MDTMSLITAQITFIESRLDLVHIPNEYYSFFTNPILRILFGDDHDSDAARIPWHDRHEFCNFSITPVGCSIIASHHLVSKFIRPAADEFNTLLQKSKSKLSSIEISHDEYVAIQVDGQGLDAGQRVLELTGPLAMAGISIFFITTYFSDYVLVPSQARHTVVTTLQQRGFVFSSEAEAYVSQLSPAFRNRNGSFHLDRPPTASSSGSDGYRTHPNSAPMTPPAKDIPELQIRTFTKLAKHGIEPYIDRNLRLVSCAGSSQIDNKFSTRLKDDLLQVLLAGPKAAPDLPTKASKQNGYIADIQDNSTSFLSMTLSAEPVSILMEERLVPQLGRSLLGSKRAEDVLVPIIFDLRSLGWNATGVVGGVAGRLSQGSATLELGQDSDSNEVVETSFLSSAKAGSVIVQERQLKSALKALELGSKEVAAKH